LLVRPVPYCTFPATDRHHNDCPAHRSRRGTSGGDGQPPGSTGETPPDVPADTPLVPPLLTSPGHSEPLLSETTCAGTEAVMRLPPGRVSGHSWTRPRRSRASTPVAARSWWKRSSAVRSTPGTP